MFFASGLTPPETGQVRPDAGKTDARQRKDFLHHVPEVPRHDAFPQIAELDHQNDAMAGAVADRRGGKLPDHFRFRIETDRTVPDDGFRFPRGRQAEEDEGRPDARFPHLPDIGNP